MALKMNMVLFLTIFLGLLVLAAKADTATVSGTDNKITYGCNNVDDPTPGIVANFDRDFSGFSDTDCNVKFKLVNGNSNIQVTFIGECSNCASNVILSNDAFGQLAGDNDSGVFEVEYTRL